jgi:hypothetical protein
MEGILKKKHAADLADLLYIVNPQTGESEGVDPGTILWSCMRPRKPADRRAVAIKIGLRTADAARKDAASNRAGGNVAAASNSKAGGQERHHQQFRQQQGRREQRPSSHIQPQPGTTFAGSDIQTHRALRAAVPRGNVSGTASADAEAAKSLALVKER